MRIFNSYILVTATVLLSTTVVLAALGQHRLDIYYTLYIIEALFITELYTYINTRTRRILNMVSLLLFGGFLVILAQRLMSLLV